MMVFPLYIIEPDTGIVHRFVDHTIGDDWPITTTCGRSCNDWSVIVGGEVGCPICNPQAILP